MFGRVPSRLIVVIALALDDTWNRAALHELMITVESQGEALGGSEERARKQFERAVQVQQGLSPGPYVALAMGIAKAKQDYAEFEKLLKQALAIDPDKDPANRLPTILTLKRARVLLAHIDDIIPR
jgi:predicted anti-sigma-YlaC factor YlaD